MEDIAERIEALQELFLEQHSSFKRSIEDVKSELANRTDSIKDIKEKMQSEESKISILEERIENNFQAIGELKNSFYKPLEESDDDDQPIPCTRRESTPEPPRKFVRLTKPTPSSDVPEFLNDLRNEDLKQKLAAMEHTIKYVKDKEKLTYCQLIYVHYWFDNSTEKITGRSGQVLRLIREGERDKIWPRNWKPAHVKSDFFTYMQDKLKNIGKRKRINGHKQSLLDAFS